MRIKKKKIFKKIILVYLVIIVCLCSLSISFADDETESEYEEIINQTNQSEIIQSVNSNTNKPTINSRKYVVFDRLSKQTIYGKDEEKQSSIASTTKIMTAIIVLENCKNLDEEVVIEQKAGSVGGSRLGLKKEDKITVNDLLFGLLMKSGNDCAIALAIHTSETIENFANSMNQKAKDLGLTKTHFTTPHGLDNPNHYSTALELAKITDYALKNEQFATIVKTKYATIVINNEKRELKNTNEVLCSDYDGVYGVKTGFTNNAGRCLVTSVKRGEIDLITVVLGADTRKDRAKDTIKLIEYAFKNFKLENIQEMIEDEFQNWKSINQERIYIHKASSKLEVKLGDIPISKMVTDNDIKIEISSMNYIEAPVEKNEKIGTITVKTDEKIIEQIDILVKKSINRMGILNYMHLFARAICL